MLNEVLAAGRLAMSTRMTAECIVYRKVGTRRDGIHVIAQWNQVYAGECERISREEQSSTVGAETESATVRTVTRVRIPIGPYRPQAGDVVKITKSWDPNMVGDLLRLSQDQPAKEHATAYRPYAQHLDGDELAEFEQGEVVIP